MVNFAGPIFDWWWGPLVILVLSLPFILAGVITWAILKYLLHEKTKHLFIKSLAVWIVIGLLTIEVARYIYSQ